MIHYAFHAMVPPCGRGSPWKHSGTHACKYGLRRDPVYGHRPVYRGAVRQPLPASPQCFPGPAGVALRAAPLWCPHPTGLCVDGLDAFPGIPNRCLGGLPWAGSAWQRRRFSENTWGLIRGGVPTNGMWASSWCLWIMCNNPCVSMHIDHGDLGLQSRLRQREG